jgi:hypothetical protein
MNSLGLSYARIPKKQLLELEVKGVCKVRALVFEVPAQ